ncbi:MULTISPECIES: RnfABCDGE type electron transport complex subunit D [Ruegeria]|uniref:RnfABCDGE type electron transport complex subunit D n=1 Tax=Ruegeria TaxID=97050 RepID=UPI00147B4CE8|nr:MULTISPECIES: RnfABCDGE type electron transport complex subunit D [Ruegeria]UUV08272.1 RnfABCDGE type electron transport complex subunit D [Ruegeria sp. YS9]
MSVTSIDSVDFPKPSKVDAGLSWQDRRIAGLSRFAIAITTLNVLGHLFLGFEQSWATPFVALLATYGTELFLEIISAREEGRRPKFIGSAKVFVQFLLSAHVTGLAIGMLLMPLEQLWVIAFAGALAIASKRLFQVAIDSRKRHFLNPSNFGITVALLLFPTVGIAPPYQFTEATSGIVDILLPLLIIGTGSLLNLKLTGRMPLLLVWVGAFTLQAVVRAYWNDTSIVAGLVPMTGFAFILFTFYMITDPATTPSNPRSQWVFGASVALLYGLFMELHIVFGMFYSLTLVTALRGMWVAMGNPLLAARRRLLAGQFVEPGE